MFQVASFAIVVNQLKSLYEEFFISVCDRCRGTGCVTCPHVRVYIYIHTLTNEQIIINN